MSRPGSIRGFANRAASLPRLAAGFAATEPWKPVSTRIGPAVGWVIR